MMTSKIARFMEPTWGPPGFCRPQMDPMLALWSLLFGLAPVAVSANNSTENHGLLCSHRRFHYIRPPNTWMEMLRLWWFVNCMHRSMYYAAKLFSVKNIICREHLTIIIIRVRIASMGHGSIENLNHLPLGPHICLSWIGSALVQTMACHRFCSGGDELIKSNLLERWRWNKLNYLGVINNIMTYAIIYVLIHQIIFRFYLLKYSLFFQVLLN